MPPAEGTTLDKILGHHNHLKWLLNRRKRNQKRLANFLHSYILTQIWSILWCIIENHLKDSEKLCLVCSKKKKDRRLWFLPYYEKKRTLKLAMFTVAVWYEAELFICLVWAWICFVSVNKLDWFLFFILLMLTDVTGFIVKLIMVNKCWLPACLCVFMLISIMHCSCHGTVDLESLERVYHIITFLTSKQASTRSSQATGIRATHINAITQISP